MIRPTKFEITEAADGQNVTLSLSGELDLRTVVELSERLDERLRSGAENVTLDLRGLVFMDSCGLRLLIELNDRAATEDWRLGLVPPEHDGAALVLRVTGADEVLPFIGPSDE